MTGPARSFLSDIEILRREVETQIKMFQEIETQQTSGGNIVGQSMGAYF